MTDRKENTTDPWNLATNPEGSVWIKVDQTERAAETVANLKRQAEVTACWKLISEIAEIAMSWPNADKEALADIQRNAEKAIDL